MLGFLYGCVSIAPAPYPEAWEKPATSISNIEKRIVGDYNCKGKTLRPSSHEVIDAGYLPQSLHMNVKGSCDTVRFSQVTVSELEITFIGDGITLETKTFLAGEDYNTADGWLVFKWSEGGKVREGYAIAGGHAGGSDSLTLDMSGNLLVKSSFTAAALIVVIPIIGYGSTWAKYERQSN